MELLLPLPPKEIVIETLGLKPLWTTDHLITYYTSSQTLPLTLLSEEFLSERPLFNCAYYLLPKNTVCPFERLFGEDIFIHSLGASVKIYTIDQKGNVQVRIMGKDIGEGELPSYVLPPGTFRAAEIVGPEEYALITEIVSPGFHIGDHEKGTWDVLTSRFPDLNEEFQRLAWPPGITWKCSAYV